MKNKEENTNKIKNKKHKIRNKTISKRAKPNKIINSKSTRRQFIYAISLVNLYTSKGIRISNYNQHLILSIHTHTNIHTYKQEQSLYKYQYFFAEHFFLFSFRHIFSASSGLNCVSVTKTIKLD